MKRCPECRRDYYDETLLYCLDDGNALLDGPAKPEPPALAGGQFVEPETAILHSTVAPGETPTHAQVHTTDATAILSTGAEAAPRGSLGRLSEKHSFSENKAARQLIAVLAVVILLVGGFFGYQYFSGSSGNQINSIAVLPFANATGDKEVDFLAEGIAETLINSFTRIPELKVTARSTAFRFRGREGEPVEIGRELNVGSMLTGRLMQRGDQLSVQVDLIKTSDGVQIWGDRYDGRTSDLVSIQQRIAMDVSRQLKLELTGAQEKEISKTYTQNPEAFQHYLRGRYHWNRRISDAMVLAVGEFQKAVEKDPTYALGYAGLADAYLLQQEYGSGTSNETLSNARAYALKALEIDPSLGEAHATLGLAAHYAYQWAEAETHFKKAIEMNPRHATAYQWYAATFRDMGRYPESLEIVLRARELDPLSGIIGVNTGLTYALKGDMSSAEEQFRRTIELDRSWWGGYFWLGLAELLAGKRDEALRNLEKGVEMNRSSRTLGTYGYALAVYGRKAEALAIARELERDYQRSGNFAVNIAAIYSGLGEKDTAFEWLDRAYEDRNSELTRLKWWPQVQPLRNDPRFKDLLKKMELPE
jgi:TolB-like protein/Flp pilus assembly protein TadD